MKKRNKLFLITVLIYIYLETVFHLFTFGFDIDINFIYLILFALATGLFVYAITNLSPSKLFNRILYNILIILSCVYFAAQFIYYKFYASIISIYSLFAGGQVFQFFESILEVIGINIVGFILLLLPIILIILLQIFKVIRFEKTKFIYRLGFIVVFLIVEVLISLSIYYIPSDEMYSNHNLYYKLHTPVLTVKRFGIINMLKLDLERIVTNFKEQDIGGGDIQEEVIIEKETEYNTTIDNWDELISMAPNNTIKDIDTYLSNTSPSKKNDYTGMFEGKNLVVFVAEAFSPLVINETLTPNLYKLQQEGFYFTNFYTPLYPVSTADGEFISDTSLIPKEGVWSINYIKDNYMPLSYANIFEGLGYTSHAYHNNTYTYYHRDKYLKAMGYDSYLACRNGLEKLINCRIWPQSDLEMMEATMNDYINDEHFLAYYMTVSGHLEYTTNGNMMATRNYGTVNDYCNQNGLNYSHKAKSYLACNIELDKAIGALLKKLEETGKLENTVISLSADHYPYGLTLSEINEISDYERDEAFEMHHNTWLLWSGDMKEQVKVDKVSESLDIVPTLYNLFGIDFDSRLFMGRDILSDSDGIVIFSNRSYITEKTKYNALTKKASTPVEEDYSKLISGIVYNKFKYSRLIIENDYYKSLYDRMNQLKKKEETSE